MQIKLTIAAACSVLLLSATAGAQSVVITNARVIDGTGKVIEHGSVVAKDGKIVSVTEGNSSGGSGQYIDAHGMTVMAGFIDAHRHVIRGESSAWIRDQAPANMKSFLDGGFTTLFSMGDDPKGILELRRKLASGEIVGPTLYAARIVPLAGPAPFPKPHDAAPTSPGAPHYTDLARIDPARPPDRPQAAPPAIPDVQSRAAVQAAKQEGFDAIKTFMMATPGGPEGHTLGVIVDEAHKQGLRVFTHATAVPDALAAVNAHIDVLAHTAHIGHLEEDQNAREALINSHVPMVSTLAVFIPHFDADNKPLFRDGGPFPMPRPLSSAGQGPVNARILWEAGMNYAYGTDTQWDARESLADELRALNLVFSAKDIIKIMGPNTAAAIGKSRELGTLEPGKRADLVILDGNPLEDVFNLNRVVVVVKDGKIVSDKRGRWFSHSEISVGSLYWARAQVGLLGFCLRTNRVKEAGTRSSSDGARGSTEGGRREAMGGLAKGLSVIRAFTRDNATLSLSEVANLTSLPAATARRCLMTLEELGYVMRNGRQFLLRPKVLELGAAYIDSMNIDFLTKTHLEELARTTSDSAALCVLDGTDIVYVARTSIRTLMRLEAHVGSRFPAYATSMGRVLLAGKSLALLQRYLETATLEQLTNHTVTDPEELRRIIEKCRRNGYSVVKDELAYGVVALAVPVFDQRGQVVAALNSSSHSSRITASKLVEDRLEMLRDVSRQITKDLASLPNLSLSAGLQDDS